jgi:outer membrane receptor for monomeric catechols
VSLCAAACGLQSQRRAQTCEKAMHLGLLRITAAAALLVCFAGGTLAADAGTYRSAPAPGWTNATHRSVSRPPAGRALRGQRSARAAWYSPNGPRVLWRVAPPIPKPPGTTILNRQILDDMNATTLRDALRYAPGATVR